VKNVYTKRKKKEKQKKVKKKRKKKEKTYKKETINLLLNRAVARSKHWYIASVGIFQSHCQS
jgi:hypothetical protein